MQPLDSDNKLYGVIVTRPHVECHDPVEFDYYKKTTAAWCDGNLCAYCAGGSGYNDGTVDESLLVEWKTVLPLCKVCCDQGALPLARYRRRNGAARAKKASKASAAKKRKAKN